MEIGLGLPLEPPKDAIGPSRLALFLTGDGGRGRRGEKGHQASRKGPPRAPLESLMPGPVSGHEMPLDRAGGAQPGCGQERAPWNQQHYTGLCQTQPRTLGLVYIFMNQMVTQKHSSKPFLIS